MKTVVLVVDDNTDITFLFEAELGNKDYEVDAALSGEEAIDKVSKKKYDIIFLDLIMPGFNGIQTCQAIKEIQPNVIITLMTGKLENRIIKNEVAFKKAGGSIYYLYKPFSEGEILKVMKKVVSESLR